MNNRRFLAISLLGMALGLAPLGAAFAQSQPGDPPGRVGRVAEMSGTVSFHTADVTQWGPASLNYPVTGGNSFWTEPRSHAAIDVGAGRIYLDSSTELDVANVDDRSFVASLAQGAVYLRVPPNANGDQYEIDTPRGAVHIVQPGSYEVVAGDGDHPTTVTAFEGSAQIVGPEVNATANPQQAIYISGQNPAQVNQGQAQTDDFIRFVQDEERPYQNAAAAPQYVSPEMTGYQDLGRYGQWNQDPGYGQVWYPQVDAGWAPYRDGHWAYVAPWGWTWVDDAPWGFTPFHYGRWVQVRNRWAWWPGTVTAQPVYAPALVSFFGGFNLGGLSIGLGVGQAVGWIPLGPEEVYVPPYRHSDRYVRNVNITYVHNETTIINVVNNKTVINNYNNYHNRNGATVVEGSTMTGSRPVAPEFHKFAPNGQFDNKRWADAKGMGGNPPIKPTTQTRGANGYKPPVSPGPDNTKLIGTNGQGKNGQFQNTNGQNGQNQNNQNLKTLNNGQPQGNGPAVVGGSNPKLPPLPAGQKPGQTQFGQGQNGFGQNGQNLKTQNNGQPQGNGPAIVGGSNSNLPPLPAGQKPGQTQFGQGQNGQNQNGQNLKVQNNRLPQPQGNGPAIVGGSNSKLPPLPAGQKPGQTQFGQGQTGQGQNGQNQNGQNLKVQNNGQPQNLKTVQPNNNSVFVPQGQPPQNPKLTKQNGNPNSAFLPQGQQQQKLKTNKPNGNSNSAFIPQGQQQGQTHNVTGGGQSTQKVQQKQQNGKGAIPLLKNEKTGQQSN
jgi:uncharacterized protein DUF6600